MQLFADHYQIADWTKNLSFLGATNSDIAIARSRPSMRPVVWTHGSRIVEENPNLDYILQHAVCGVETGVVKLPAK
jgi:hypothetical protein